MPTTWSLMIWFSVAPGAWSALEIPQPSLEECHARVQVVAQFARAIKVHEFVIRCEGKS
jgi:hypothetical protein